jgi:hypothetical protein
VVVTSKLAELATTNVADAALVMAGPVIVGGTVVLVIRLLNSLVY